jgi:FtsP/CotA-like multicopper oxidase with cupredoxin domain
MTRGWLHRIARVPPICLTFAALGLREHSLPPVDANQNHAPAGILREGVLTVQLEIAEGEWHPESDDGMTLSVYAFGEVGHPLQNPGPLIRVPQGTEIRASLQNTLAVPVMVHGFGDPSGREPGSSDAGVRVAPGVVMQIRFKATTPGLYFYWGASEVNDLKLRHGIDSELTGAFVVDPPGASANDEIFVLEMISEHAGASSRQTLATINGKSWPYTQRFQYEVGQAVRWRWINATNEPHALHLHGFYYRIDAFNRGGQVQRYHGESRPMVVTQRIAQGETFDMSWSPDRPGRWLFHCHMLQHMIPAVVPKLPGLSMGASLTHGNEHAATHDVSGLGQLVLGITVPGTTDASSGAEWHADRKLQLTISERGGAPRYALQLRDDAQAPAAPGEPGLIGPPIVLTRGQPVEIEVLNKLQQPTAIHWHGIELESYYDGVPGWSGTSTQTTPPIAPGASFVARMIPPRAGTFIYHTHWHDESQLTNGVYGPLIVLPPGEKLDPTSDLVFLFSIGNFALQEMALINGTPQSKTLQLQAGKKYRFRLINISTNNQGMQVSLRNTDGPVDWRIIAKDGADLPPDAVRSSKAQLTITVGETYDVEFSAAAAQDLLLDLLLPAQKIHSTQTLSFAPASPVAQ